MRERGYYCEVVEHWNSFTHQRKDLFGFADIICLGWDEVIVVQTTDLTSVSKRINKITDHENLAAVRKAGIGILVHGWGKRAGKRTYEVREVDLS
jgi:hypothetical protein